MNFKRKLAQQESNRQFTLRDQRIASMLNHTNSFGHISINNNKPEGPLPLLALASMGFIGGIVLIIVLAHFALKVLISWGVM